MRVLLRYNGEVGEVGGSRQQLLWYNPPKNRTCAATTQLLTLSTLIQNPVNHITAQPSQHRRKHIMHKASKPWHWNTTLQHAIKRIAWCKHAWVAVPVAAPSRLSHKHITTQHILTQKKHNIEVMQQPPHYEQRTTTNSHRKVPSSRTLPAPPHLA
jgi:hypothetical protein